MKKFLIALLLSSSLIMATAHAEIQTYTGTDEYTVGEHETQANAKEYSKIRALRHAQEQTGFFISSYSQAKNFKLVKDEIIVIAQGIMKIIGEPDYKVRVLDDGKSTLIRTTITVQIDTDDVDRRLAEIGRRNEKIPDEKPANPAPTLQPKIETPPPKVENPPAANESVKIFVDVGSALRGTTAQLIKVVAQKAATMGLQRQAEKYVNDYCISKGYKLTNEQISNFVKKNLKVDKKVDYDKETRTAKVKAELDINKLDDWLKRISK